MFKCINKHIYIDAQSSSAHYNVMTVLREHLDLLSYDELVMIMEWEKHYVLDTSIFPITDPIEKWEAEYLEVIEYLNKADVAKEIKLLLKLNGYIWGGITYT